ncbi:hypothetical protein PHAVU_005G091100 [Phaseolus vulgaris]|uniref:DUF1995 domain-containing protein n=1 Tax=Phaseolus vulgaris TaxID=3885 RepID=V7BUL4_PHAVU|nr:hypothetical protein PHAVU_005G091100g [Phaseolus vulgaris]ESW21687.1 hypothetical protein PHAVU_005G091100g [Phaseolus vulgaris]
MASSYLSRPHFQSIQISKPSSCPPPHSNTKITSISFPTQYLYNHCHNSCINPCSFVPLKATSTSIHSSLSSLKPPISKEEAILQAKTSLSTTLEKPLNNPKLIGKFKKLRQPKFRVEIPVIDDSPDSLSQLALDFFGDLPIKRKGSPTKILILWPDASLKESATVAFQSHSTIEHIDIPSVAKTDPRILNSADVAIFLAPDSSQLALIKRVSEAFYTKPVVLFNPKWAFEEESNFGDLSGFVGSFEVVYSFMGLEVRGILSKRKGVVFKCVRDGVASGERWNVFVEEGEELKVISSFKARPNIAEVENVLYNLMAINSPITKSAKFIKGLVSNVTGRK